MLIGMPIANRTRLEVEKLIGFFVNQLVVRGEVRADQKFLDLLKHVREVVLGAYTNQDVPFERVVEALNPERDMSRSPLFQVVLSWQNAPSSGLKLENVELSPIEMEYKSVRYDIELVLWEHDGQIVGNIEYNSDLYEPETIARMGRHLNQLLESIAGDPNQHISNLALLEESETQQLARWNQTQRDYPRDLCIHNLFEEQVKRTPDATAVVCEGKQLTYAELNQRANQLAHQLRAFGVGPEVLVGLCVESSIELVIGILGVLKAGGAYVPLDPSYPRERLQFMIDDAKPAVILTPEVLSATEYTDQSHRSDPDLIRRFDPHHPCYLIYTSGSTGKPKGVLVPHRGLVNHALYCAERYGLTSEDRVLQFASIGFDVAAEEIFPTLLSGATLVLWPKRRSSGFDALLELIEDENLSVLNLPAAYWHEWVSDLERTREQVPDCLRLLIVGSDKVISERATQWRKLLWHDVQLLNAYGLTETTITTTIFEPSADVASPSLPIGRPIANSQIHLLDETINPVPIGFAGELYIGGESLARGYLNQVELTAARFIPDPFSSVPGARLYRTGDLARYLPDGNLEILGRADEQVKIRGFRIELGEIESVLVQHESVLERVVIAREDEPGNKQLVAYLVANPETTLELSELRAYLREHLPEYMLPARFQLLERLPLTANGKIDRQALPAPDLTQHEIVASERMNWTPTQEMLAGIWCAVLGLDHIGLDDNFFDLGGHSLLATQASSRVQEAFAVEFLLHNFFETPVLRDMAEVLEEAHRSHHGMKPAPLARVSRDQVLPLSYAQQRLWFIDQLEPGNPFYNCPGAARLKGQLDVEVLERSINEVIRRHESLRTTFPMVDGQPRQAIADEMYVYLTVEDLSYLSPAEAENEAERYVAEEAQQSFDLSIGPLLSVRLLRLGVDDHIVVFTMHHIIADGWSAGVLISEIGTLYEAFSKGQSSPLAELPVQYADYAVWQREWSSGEVLERQLDYWKDHLEGAPPVLDLPTDRPRPDELTFRGARLPVIVSEEISESLRGLSRREGVTMFMTVFAAFNLLLSHYSGSDDLVVSTDLANRDRVETEGLIGFFVNQLPLRTNLAGDPTFSELLQRVRKVALGSYAHEHISLDRLVEALNPERSLQYTPLFQVNLTFQNTPETSVNLPGLALSPVEMKVVTAQLDLSINFAEVDRALVGALEYKTDLFDAATMQQLVDDLRLIFTLVAENPERRLSEVKNIVAEQSREQRLVHAREAKEATRRKLTGRRRSTTIAEIIPDNTPDDVPLAVG
jgi:amino acid adenylation domain-containing protein